MSAVKAFSRASRSATVSCRAAKAPVKTAPPKAGNNLTILAKLADAGVLSSVEKAGVLSQVEKAGLLSYAEKNGLLSFAEKSGVIGAIADPSTPGALSIVGFLLLVGGGATGVTYSEVPAADVAAVLLGVAGLAAIAGGSVLERVQKL